MTEVGFLVYRYSWSAAPEGASRAGGAKPRGSPAPPGAGAERGSSPSLMALASRVHARVRGAMRPPEKRVARGPIPLPWNMTSPCQLRAFGQSCSGTRTSTPDFADAPRAARRTSLAAHKPLSWLISETGGHTFITAGAAVSIRGYWISSVTYLSCFRGAHAMASRALRS